MQPDANSACIFEPLLGDGSCSDDFDDAEPHQNAGRLTQSRRCAVCWEDIEPTSVAFRYHAHEAAFERMHCFHLKCVVFQQHVACPLCRASLPVLTTHYMTFVVLHFDEAWRRNFFAFGGGHLTTVAKETLLLRYASRFETAAADSWLRFKRLLGALLAGACISEREELLNTCLAASSPLRRLATHFLRRQPTAVLIGVLHRQATCNAEAAASLFRATRRSVDFSVWETRDAQQQCIAAAYVRAVFAALDAVQDARGACRFSRVRMQQLLKNAQFGAAIGDCSAFHFLHSRLFAAKSTCTRAAAAYDGVLNRLSELHGVSTDEIEVRLAKQASSVLLRPSLRLAF